MESREKLEEHIRLFHTSPNALPSCYVCGKLFAKRSGLEAHAKTKHRTLYEVFCDFPKCRQVFLLKADLKEHRILCQRIYKQNLAIFNQAGDQVEDAEREEEAVLP